MEREILFRGKRKDNGEWIKGYYVPLGDKYHYILTGKLTIIKNFPVFEHFYVIPETIGRYTDLRDKNKVRIFEGDIIKTKKYGKDVGHSNVNDYDIFVVTYEPCMFRLINKTRGFCLDDDGYSKQEVIGNIHDNPEMREKLRYIGL